jgi:hypothetical protein
METQTSRAEDWRELVRRQDVVFDIFHPFAEIVFSSRLVLHASPEERKNCRLIGKGQGIHWEDIDEDVSVEGLLAGKSSGESQSSFKKWFASRSPPPTKRSSRRRSKG